MMSDGDANKLAGIVYELVRSKREGNIGNLICA